MRRVGRARVTLLVKVPGVGGADFAPWNASDYHGQSNPQTAGPSGWFAFYPPPGTYRVRVEAAGYNPYLSPERTISVEPVMIQIPLQPIGRVYLPAVRRGAR